MDELSYTKGQANENSYSNDIEKIKTLPINPALFKKVNQVDSTNNSQSLNNSNNSEAVNNSFKNSITEQHNNNFAKKDGQKSNSISNDPSMLVNKSLR